MEEKGAAGLRREVLFRRFGKVRAFRACRWPGGTPPRGGGSAESGSPLASAAKVAQHALGGIGHTLL